MKYKTTGIYSLFEFEIINKKLWLRRCIDIGQDEHIFLLKKDAIYYNPCGFVYYLCLYKSKIMIISIKPNKHIESLLEKVE